MVISEINRLNTLLEGSGLIENYGGLCVHKVKNGEYFGYQLDTDSNENVFSKDERHASSGYIHLLPPKIDPIDKRISKLTFQINLELFVTPKQTGHHNKYYQKALEVYQHIKSNKAFKSVDVVLTSRDHESLELSTITLTYEKHVGCDYTPDYLTPILC